MWWLVVVLCGARFYPNLWKLCGYSTVKKSKPPRCGGVVWCGGVVFITDYNTTLRLHWVNLGCGNCTPRQNSIMLGDQNIYYVSKCVVNRCVNSQCLQAQIIYGI